MIILTDITSFGFNYNFVNRFWIRENRLGFRSQDGRYTGECNFCVAYRILRGKTFKYFFYEIFYIRQICKGGNKRVIVLEV